MGRKYFFSSQQRSGGCKHHGDDVGAVQIVLEGNIEHQQHCHNGNDGEQHRVEERRTGAPVERRHEKIDAEGQGEAEQGALQDNVDHARSSFFPRSMSLMTPVTV